MEKLITLQERANSPYHNWAGISPVHVVKEYDSWLVVNYISGQDNIASTSHRYATPPLIPGEWINEYVVPGHPRKFEVEYEFSRKVIPELEVDLGSTQVYFLIAPGDGCIRHDGLHLYIEGVPVEKVHVPSLHKVFGIPLEWFHFGRDTRNELIRRWPNSCFL